MLLLNMVKTTQHRQYKSILVYVVWDNYRYNCKEDITKIWHKE